MLRVELQTKTREFRNFSVKLRKDYEMNNCAWWCSVMMCAKSFRAVVQLGVAGSNWIGSRGTLSLCTVITIIDGGKMLHKPRN